MQKLKKYNVLPDLIQDLKIFLVESLGDDVLIDDIEFLRPSDEVMGDISTNFALKKASKFKKKPRDFAQELKLIVEKSTFSVNFNKIETAGPGFLNFYFSDLFISNGLQYIKNVDKAYGSSNIGNGKNIIFEFVSANPTGPLTIAHARQAAVGDTLCRIYKKIGYHVCAEYYLNDRGVQIYNLGHSVYSRYMEKCGFKADFPENGYKGEYIVDLAESIFQDENKKYVDWEKEKAISAFSDKAYHVIFDEIKNDIKEFNVHFDTWFSERKLEEEGRIENALKDLQDKKIAYEKDGALWFRTTDFGDDKDRVLVKSDGSTTYLASDIPYHWDKLKRGFGKLVNLVGPDHHGYISRLKAAVDAYDEKGSEKLKVLIVQLVTLYRGKTQVRMSTRLGEFISLRELIDEVGIDAARYYFARRKPESLLDFDIELAKQQTPDNPVFYVQYVYARIASILRKYKEQFGNRKINPYGDLNWNSMENGDRSLIKSLLRFPDTVKGAALNFEPQRITLYLENLAAVFHSYYNKNKILDPDNTEKMDMRIHIIKSVALIIKNGLEIVGAGAPEKM
ncbi:MAG: arginine--tRNA ligase [Candidatus Aureabacteria bacterium]|nr:arginine--tRNA ligase [Candidatus Auribacterota bacterium]